MRDDFEKDAKNVYNNAIEQAKSPSMALEIL